NTSTSLLRSHLTFYSCVSYLKDPATTEIYTLSLHDALPIYVRIEERLDLAVRGRDFGREGHHRRGGPADRIGIGRCQRRQPPLRDRKSTRLNSSHVKISYAVFCLKKKKKNRIERTREVRRT